MLEFDSLLFCYWWWTFFLRWSFRLYTCHEIESLYSFLATN